MTKRQATLATLQIYNCIAATSYEIIRNHTKSYEINISLFITFARPSEKYHVCPAVSVPEQCRVSALVSASCFRSSSASRSLRWRSWSESSIVTSSSCMQCGNNGNIQIPTAAVQGTQGCLHKSCKIIIPGQFWSTMLSCCLPFRFIHSCAYSVILSAFERRPLLVTGVSAARPFPGLGAVIPAPSPWTSQIWKCN